MARMEIMPPARTRSSSDTFAIIGAVLAIAAVALLFARKVKPGAGAGAH
jgi:hypothetical protein